MIFTPAEIRHVSQISDGQYHWSNRFGDCRAWVSSGIVTTEHHVDGAWVSDKLVNTAEKLFRHLKAPSTKKIEFEGMR